MKRKTHYQPALAPLSPEEKDQLADWLRKDTYEIVLARCTKPREAGGFGLKMSIRPLQTFHAKVLLLDAINARLPADKKMTISDLESIAKAERLLASLGTSETNSTFGPRTSDLIPEEVHTAIMDATYDIVMEGNNTPAQLLSLQRLVDFPARAELRAAKEERQCERHSWKREMHDHKFEMDAHRKHIAEERLTLAKRGFELREHLALEEPNSKLSTCNSALEDDLGPLALTGDDIERRTCKKFNIPYPADASASADPSSPTSSNSYPIIDTGIQAGGPNDIADSSVSTLSKTERSTELYRQTEKTSHQVSAPSSTPPVPVSEKSIPSVVEAPPQLPTTNSQLSVTESNPNSSAEIRGREMTADAAHGAPEANPAIGKAAENTSSFCLLNSALKDHAIRRWRAHIPRPEGTPEPDGSWRNECPCGKPLPCTDHPELHFRIRYYRPQHPDFPLMLKEADVPYYVPTAKELGCAQEAVDKSRDPFGYNPRVFPGFPLGPAMQQFAST